MLSSMYSRISRWRAVSVTSGIWLDLASGARSAEDAELAFGGTVAPAGPEGKHLFGERVVDRPLDRERAFVLEWAPRRTAVPPTGVRPRKLSDPLRKITSWLRSSPPHPTTRSSATAARTSAWSPAAPSTAPA